MLLSSFSIKMLGFPLGPGLGQLWFFTLQQCQARVPSYTEALRSSQREAGYCHTFVRLAASVQPGGRPLFRSQGLLHGGLHDYSPPEASRESSALLTLVSRRGASKVRHQLRALCLMA